AGEHHVPDPVGPAADGAVPGVPLLLRVRSHRAVDAAVGDVPAAGPAVAVRRQVEPAAYVHAPERGGLGDGPAIGAADRDDGQVLRRTPEVLRGVAVEPARVDRDVTVEGGVVGGEAKPRDRRVEPDLGVEAAVRARLEPELVAPGPELVRFLAGEHLVEPGLDVPRGRVEDDHVGAEVAAALEPTGSSAVPRGGGGGGG